VSLARYPPELGGQALGSTIKLQRGETLSGLPTPSDSDPTLPLSAQMPCGRLALC